MPAFSLLASLSFSACDDGQEARDSQTACLETQEFPDWPQTIYTTKTWDDPRRVLTAVSIRMHDPSTRSTLEWRYASEGRILSYGEIEQPFQHDYQYDAHDNVAYFVLSYPDHFDVTTASSAAPYIETRYANEYDTSGRLVASTVTQTGPSASPPARVVYTEDTAGRCSRIETTWDDQTTLAEARTYDDAGRVATIEVTRSSGFASTETYTYDASGRPLTDDYSTRGWLHPGSVSSEYTYSSDGSVKKDVMDTINDVSSAQHWTLSRSPACAAIDASVGAPADARCRIR